MAIKALPPQSAGHLAEIAKPIEVPSFVMPALALAQLPPAADLQRMVATVAELQRNIKTFAAQPWFREVLAASGELGRMAVAFQREWEATFRPLAPMIQELARENARQKRIEAAGWLPHYTTPWRDVAAAETSDGDIAKVLEAHYRDAWAEVKSGFLIRLETYEIDAESKATFVDALTAHEAGAFRCTARTLFPEIERVARIELHGGSLERIASQKRLRQAAGELVLSDVEPGGIRGLALFSKLLRDLYAEARTPEDVARREADPVPNRHASLHGLVAYSTRQSSINALIMCDYIFQVFTALKRNQLEDAA